MKWKLFLLLSLCLIVRISASGQEAWTLKKDKNGIKVFTRKTADFKFDELKVECEFEGRASQLAAILLDVNNHYRWAYKTVKSQLLKAISDTDLFFYNEVDCPWPFQNRDVVVHMTLVQNSINKIITVVATSEKDYLPDKVNIVRMRYSKVTWLITPLYNNKLKIEYRIQIDPGGSVPAWLLNSFASKGPYESFTKLKQEMNLPRFAQAKFSFLKD